MWSLPSTKGLGTGVIENVLGADCKCKSKPTCRLYIYSKVAATVTVCHALFADTSPRFKWKNSVDNLLYFQCSLILISSWHPVKHSSLNPIVLKSWLNQVRNAPEKIVRIKPRFLTSRCEIQLTAARCSLLLSFETYTETWNFFFFYCSLQNWRRKAGRIIACRRDNVPLDLVRWKSLQDLCPNLYRVTSCVATVDFPFLAPLIDDPLTGCMTIH